MSDEAITVTEFYQILAMTTAYPEKKEQSSLAERSGVAQPCPPSANGCPEARADGRPGADSSVRCPEVNGPALARIERLCEAFIEINDGETAKDTDDLLDAAWLVIRQIYEIAVVEQVKPDAGQCNGQRVLPDNDQAER